MLMDEIRTEPAQCPPAERPAGISILELTSATCRWPLWGFRERPVNGGLYCGAPVAGADVYCEGHCAMTGRAPKPVSAPAPARVAQRPSESRTVERGPQPRLSRVVTPRARRAQVEEDVASWRERYGAARQRLAPAAPAQPEAPPAAPAPKRAKRRREPSQFVPCPAPPARPMATPLGNGGALVRMLAQFGFSQRIIVEDVLRAVSRHFAVSRTDLVSDRRTHRLLMPRQIAMYLAREMTTASMPMIGRAIGDRDHTTILHGSEKIRAQAALNPALVANLAALRLAITAEAAERAASLRPRRAGA